MNIELTEWQTEVLKPLFDKAKIAFNKKEPVGIFAQIWENADMAEPSFMVVRVVSGEICRFIQTATEVKVGKIGTGVITVLRPEQ